MVKVDRKISTSLCRKMTSSCYNLSEESKTFQILNSKFNSSCYTMIILGHHKLSHVDLFSISRSATCVSTYLLKLQDFYRYTPYILGHLTYIPNQSYYCYALAPLTERLQCILSSTSVTEQQQQQQQEK
jgi:hypothetical protein